jgi:hypothetical protein
LEEALLSRKEAVGPLEEAFLQRKEGVGPWEKAFLPRKEDVGPWEEAFFPEAGHGLAAREEAKRQNAGQRQQPEASRRSSTPSGPWAVQSRRCTMGNIATKVKSVQPNDLKTELTEVDAGVVNVIPVTTSMTINGSVMTQVQIDAKLKGYLATIQAADAAWQQYQTALAGRRNIQLEAHDFVLHLKKVIIASLGSQNPQLAEFGLPPAKPMAARTAAQNVVTAAKAGLTRKARGQRASSSLPACSSCCLAGSAALVWSTRARRW